MKKYYILIFLVLIIFTVIYFSRVTTVGYVIQSIKDEKISPDDDINKIDIEIYCSYYRNMSADLRADSVYEELKGLLNGIIVHPVIFDSNMKSYKPIFKETYTIIMHYDYKIIVVDIYNKYELSINGKDYRIINGYDYEKLFEFLDSKTNRN